MDYRNDPRFRGLEPFESKVWLSSPTMHGEEQRWVNEARPNHGTMEGKKVFCSDTTFDASINPVGYEDGEAVFIDTEYDTWNMSPEALEKAFEIYPDVRLVVIAHLYGTPGKMEELKQICDAHSALIIEDAAESLGAKYKLGGRWGETGALGSYNCISFNGNKILTGSSGGTSHLETDAYAAVMPCRTAC